MLKKIIFPIFSFNSHKGGPSGRNLKPSGKEASPIVQKKRSLFAALTGEEQPHFMGGLLLTLVVLLHVWAGLWLLKPADEAPKAPSLVIMEVSLVAPPAQQAPVTPPAPKPEPPKPEPPKKQPAKKPVVKKTPVIPKQVELPKPQTITEEKPAVANTAPVSAPQPVSRPAPAVNTEPRISTGVVPLERVPPKYPARAADRHIEGWVKIEFTITTSGDVENAVVVEAEPAETFDDAALKAINQWKFKEKIVNGVAVEQRAVQTLQFKLTR
jgi:protein TonB